MIRVVNQLPFQNKLSAADLRNIEKSYQTLTFKQFQESAKFDLYNSLLVPLLKVLDLPSTSLNPSGSIQVTDVNNTIHALGILEKTPARTMANYIGWRIVYRFGSYSSEQFRQNFFDFLKAVYGVEKMQTRTEWCSNLANTIAPQAVSRLYVDKHFSRNAKESASQMISGLQDSLRSLLQTNEWLDAKTKTASLNKLSHVKKNVAYPEWLIHNDQLDAFYNLHGNQTQKLLDETNYLLTLATFSALQLKQKLTDFEKPIDFDKNWPMTPAMINAGYQPLQNSVSKFSFEFINF